MDFIGDVLTTIIEHRIGELDEASRKCVNDQASELVNANETVAVRLSLKRCECKKHQGCDEGSAFEVWQLQRFKTTPEGCTSMPLLPMFLKNAIRSQLHFSPFSACLANTVDKRLPQGYICDHVISASGELTVMNGTPECHSFPLCKYTIPDSDECFYLVVKVQFIRFTTFPKLICCCPKNTELTETWILPAETSSKTPDDDDPPPTPTLDDDFDGFAYFLGLTAPKIEIPRSPTRRSQHVRSRRFTATEVPPLTPTILPRPRNAKSFCGVMPIKGYHFHPKTRLPINSSPAPLKRVPLSLAAKLRARGIVLDTSNSDSSSSDTESVTNDSKPVKFGSPQSTHALLCNFEESVLKGRLEPVSSLTGFSLQMSVVGSAFSVPHTELPMSTYFFNVSANDAPSLYLGHCLFKDSPFDRKAVHIPKKCVVQATLFNPQHSVVRIFLLKINVSDMPPRSRTFIRQRTVAASLGDDVPLTSGLRFLIHLRLATNRSGKVFMHTDVRLLFSANQTDLDLINLVVNADGNATNNEDGYELTTTTEMPSQPKYSPLK